MPLDPAILFQGQGGVVPDWNRSRAQAISLAAAAQDLKTRQLAAQQAQQQLAQQKAAQAIITQAAVQGSGLGTPTTPGAVSTASTAGPGGTTAIPATAPVGTTRTPEGFLVRPDSAAAASAPGQGGYVGSDAATAPADSAVPDATPAQGDSAAPAPQAGSLPAQPEFPADQSTSQPADGADDSPDNGPVSVADSAAPPSEQTDYPAMATEGMADAAVGSLPPAYASIAAIANGDSRPHPVAAPPAPGHQLTPYQQLAKRAGVSSPVLKSNPYDLIDTTKQQLLQSGLPSAYADAYEQNAIKAVEANAASKANQSLAVNKAYQARHQTASDSFANFYNGVGSEAQRAAAWPAWLAGQVRDQNLTSDEVAPYQQYPGDDMAKQIASHWKGELAINKAVIDQQTAAKSQGEAAQANSVANLNRAKQAELDQKNTEAARSSDHAALSGVALSGLPALIKAYDAMTPARRAQVAVNPHELDAATYNPKTVAAQLAYSGLSPEKQQLANEAAAKMAEYGTPVEMNRRAEMGDPVAIRVRKSMNDQAIKLALVRGEAARAASAGGSAPGAPKPPPIGTLQ